ncbi:hypothetical protein HQ43_05195 [Porphyromonas canoris]|uniref:Conjugal transfer protein n=2 Tax=Porphyromonas canoris TaxID=36875 RepID=A0ABR4XKW4_9PORP|nr:hypothetical protein HQ43_05195 [Porphyromonas canoris]
MQTILLNVLLCLGIIWLLLLIRYTYYYIQFSRREDRKAAKTNGDKIPTAEETKQKPEEAHTLVGKSKGLSSEDFPKLPAIPKTEVSATQANTFAPPKAQEGGEVSDTTEEAPSDEPSISKEENEMQVAFTTDEVDEDEVAKEEMLLTRDPMPEVSPSAILARDLVRMGRWSKNDEELDEEDETEVQDTLSKVQGTDLMEKYLENLKAEEGKHSKLLAFVRKAEEKQRQAEELGDERTQTINTNDTHPLDYYL